ncbi:MAG: hypothetical protein ABIC82_01170 [bacterium]
MHKINKLNTDKMANIAQIGEIMFHAKDLAGLWRIENTNTLYNTIARYVKKGALFRIYKGFYSIKPIDEIDPFVLGTKAIHKYCYISAETVLTNKGIIQQNIDQITFMASKTKKLKIGDNNYYVRQLDEKYLYNSEGINAKDNFKIASLERAVADMLYFNPKTFFDAKNLINWQKMRAIQKKIGYPLTDRQ